VRRPVLYHRLQGADRRPPRLRRGLDLRRRCDRHRGPSRPPGARAVGQLDERPKDGALSNPLRAADLPEESLPEAGADEARRISGEGHPAPDQIDARPRHLEAAIAMTSRFLALLLLLLPLPAAAELRLPSGFTAQVYVTGEGFDIDTTRGIRGIPAT